MVCKANTSIHNFPNFTNEPQNMKNFLTYRHCKSFPRLLDSPLKCDGPVNSKEVFLLLAIKSSPVNYERREAIRRTWGAEKTYNGANVRRIFISGIPKPQKESNRIIQLLAIESKTYGDIVQWNFEDSFYNLTLKQVLFHQWLLESCPYAHFIFNGDDDIFLNTFNVLTYLQEFRDSGRDHPLFVGQLNTFMPPIRNKNSKYYVPEELFREEYFPPYCGGGGIIMSSFTAHSIFKESQHIPLFPIDDAYLGMCLQRAGLKPGNHEGIRTLGIKLPNSVDSFDPCIYRQMLMVHRFVPYEMLVMWKAVQVTNLECKKRSIKHGVYRKYNFTEQELGHGIV
ncbi:N-acetyllactosaminide beta-1,3-N-acetylglucosaminyltransferase 3-like [Bombina bombina]|uniref:N-acetyllactosaminide beta-1,3-N-acetylglucosaminyltransferase 3-like n=1 Tax=Bombina bombina TaxID=8345 RepID=UPI00235A78DB|nr:N-acetyllactosaminide beta-1,3-N-acetylglucosaminyltransferase 3-like [Bombina bombina]